MLGPIFQEGFRLNSVDGDASRYRLDCVDCSFTTVVYGDLSRAHEKIQIHQQEVQADQNAHFVNIREIE